MSFLFNQMVATYKNSWDYLAVNLTCVATVEDAVWCLLVCSPKCLHTVCLCAVYYCILPFYSTYIVLRLMHNSVALLLFIMCILEQFSCVIQIIVPFYSVLSV